MKECSEFIGYLKPVFRLISIALPLAFCTTLVAADAPILPKATETDARLRSDGKGWRLDQAQITDPARPRVLLIGDSILNSYVKLTTIAPEGKAQIDAWVKPVSPIRILQQASR